MNILITSWTMRLDAESKNPKSPYLKPLYTVQAKIYADRYRDAGHNVEVSVGTKFPQETFFGHKIIRGSELYYPNYDLIINLGVRANIIGGDFAPLMREVFHALRDGYKGEMYIFFDDLMNLPENQGLKFQRRYDEGKIKPGMEEYFEQHIDAIRYTTRFLESDQIKLICPGGTLPWKPSNLQYGLNYDYEVIMDPWQNYLVGKELDGNNNYPIIPVEELWGDVIYAGTMRSYRFNLLKELFQNAELSTGAFIRKDSERKRYDNALMEQNLFCNHKDYGSFPLHEALYIHSRFLINPIVGDKWQNGDFVSPRFWSSLRFPSVVAIHESYDPNHKLLRSELLRKYCYWSSVQDLIRLKENLLQSEYLRTELIYAAGQETPSNSYRGVVTPSKDN